jgi:putative ABC transport system substrate-binding protein
MQAAARVLALQLHVLHASTQHEMDKVFASAETFGVDGLVITTDPLFTGRMQQLATLSLGRAVPTIFQYREFAYAGGLMSYGESFTEPYRQQGLYTARILKGDKPANLPVQQSTKVELFLNLKTAKAVGVTFPITLLGRADEIFE